MLDYIFNNFLVSVLAGVLLYLFVYILLLKRKYRIQKILDNYAMSKMKVTQDTNHLVYSENGMTARTNFTNTYVLFFTFLTLLICSIIKYHFFL